MSERVLIAIFIGWNIISLLFLLDSGPLGCNGNHWYHNISILYWRLIVIGGFIFLCYLFACFFV